MPREMTIEECQAAFLKHVWVLIDYWSKLPGKTERERMDGLAFSMLVAIDGEAMAVPSFTLAPAPHPDDKEYRRSQGNNWWPPSGVDIAGPLHDQFHDAGLKLGYLPKQRTKDAS